MKKVVKTLLVGGFMGSMILTGCSAIASSDDPSYDPDYVEALESKVAELEATNDTLREQLMYYSGLVHSAGIDVDNNQSLQESPATQYKCMDEVITSLPEDGLVQVDDVVFSLGRTETLADVVAAFEAKGYTTDYYPRQVGRRVVTTVYKNQASYLEISSSSTKLATEDELSSFVDHGAAIFLFQSDEACNMVVESITLTPAAKANTFFFGGIKADGSNVYLDGLYSQLETIAGNSEYSELSGVTGSEMYSFSYSTRIIPKNDPYPAVLLKYIPEAHNLRYSFGFEKINQKGVEINVSHHNSENDGIFLTQNDVSEILKEVYGVEVDAIP